MEPGLVVRASDLARIEITSLSNDRYRHNEGDANGDPASHADAHSHPDQDWQANENGDA